MTFKVGDRVRVVSNIGRSGATPFHWHAIGSVGTVRRVRDQFVDVVVGDKTQGVYLENIEPAVETTTTTNESGSNGFTVKDSGSRQEFAGGMLRDTATGKPDIELIFNGPMADRWADHLTKGAKKYPDPEPGKANWTRAAGTEEQVRFRKSAVRHFRQWLRGDMDEDHAAAVFFNINGYEYVKGQPK